MLAPLLVQGRRAGTLIAFYRRPGRPPASEVRVVMEAASLVSAQLELSVVADQEERLARAELRALRAEISPHFIYNALAAVAGDIHTRPDDARELLIDFAEFTRYLFRDGRSYVTLAEELEHVERYLRLEQARFHSLHVDARRGARDAGGGRTGDVGAAAGGECRPSWHRTTRGHRTSGGAVPASWARTSSCGSPTTAAGIDPERLPGLIAGAGGGIGLANVDGRLRATFGERYALRLESELGKGTTAIMTVPNLVGEDGLQAAGRGDGGSRRMSGDQLTILAVDDERTQLEDLARLLRNSPSVKEVECAYDGHDALVKASTQAYDAIFLDVRMPNLDGLELGPGAAPLRRAAAAGVRLGLRQRGGRRLRAPRARLPAQAGGAAARGGGDRARRGGGRVRRGRTPGGGAGSRAGGRARDGGRPRTTR